MLQDSFQWGYGQIRITPPIVNAIKIAATSAQNLSCGLYEIKPVTEERLRAFGSCSFKLPETDNNPDIH
jgi:hypothetical protein